MNDTGLYFQDHPRESRVRRGPSPVQEGCKIRAHGTFTSRVQSYPAKRRESDTSADSLGHGPLWRVAYRIGGSAADVALAVVIKVRIAQPAKPERPE